MLRVLLLRVRAKGSVVVYAIWLLVVIYVTCRHLQEVARRRRITARARWDRAGLLREVKWLGKAELLRLDRLRSGLINRHELEVVICASKSDNISWSNLYSSVRTVVYDDDGDSSSAVGKMILQHVVGNYNSLADLTVFSSGFPPTRSNPLLSNSSFHDFALANATRFVFTGAVWLPTMAQRTRRGLNRGALKREQGLNSCPTPPLDAPGGTEGKFELEDNIKQLKRIAGLCEKGTVKVGACTGPALWDNLLGLPRPPFDTLLFSFGPPLFSVTREQLLRRPLDFYNRLLSLVAAGGPIRHLLPFSWWYALGGNPLPPGPHPGMPCALSGHEFKWAEASPASSRSDFRERLAIHHPLTLSQITERDQFRATFD